MLKVQNLSKAYSGQVVFDDASFLMTPGERLGLVGRNGSGKTTLFRLLLREEQPDEGTIVMPKGYRIGHLSQHLRFDRPTILDEVTAVLGDRIEEECYRAEAALMGLGFSREDLERPASAFSGGYQIRVNLARVLVEQPDLLLLDEPTNYLDIVAVRWLERFLQQWQGELILITHDRQFLSRVTTHTLAVHRKRLRRMEGSVEKLYEQIGTEEEVYETTRVNDEKKRAREERFIERFRSKASKASVVQSRIKALERRGRMEALETEDDLEFSFRAAPFHSSVMLRAEDLAFGFPGGPTLLEDLGFTIDKGDRVAIIGPNGRGKTTLLNLLAGELKPQRGKIVSNPNTKIAYFGQTNIARLDSTRTVEQEILAAWPDGTRTGVRSLCGLLMFSGDLAAKPISVLSGGERSRVLLGKLLVAPANLLLLDEPTNHLDVESIDGLLDAVDAFPGGVLLVTHSEMILDRLATRLIVFDGGKATLFEGTYRDFLDRVGWQGEADQRRPGKTAERRPGKGVAKTDGAKLRKLKAEIVSERGRVTAPLKRKVDQLENRIEQLEREVIAHDQELVEAANQGRTADLARLGALAKRKRAEIESLFGELETAADALDTTRASFDARLEDLA